MITVIVTALMILYCTYIYRNHAVFDFSDNILTDNTTMEMYIYLNEDTGDTKIDGYKDINNSILNLYLNSDIEIEYIEPSENIETIHIYCSGMGINDLKDFSEFYSNLLVVEFNECNFPDNYSIDLDKLTYIEFINNTNFDYKLLEENKSLKTIRIEDENLQSEDIPNLNDQVERLKISIKSPIMHNFDGFPQNSVRIELTTTYEGDENEDTIYGLENYENLIEFEYENAKYITQESYAYAIENDISGIPKDIEVIE